MVKQKYVLSAMSRRKLIPQFTTHNRIKALKIAQSLSSLSRSSHGRRFQHSRRPSHLQALPPRPHYFNCIALSNNDKISAFSVRLARRLST